MVGILPTGIKPIPPFPFPAEMLPAGRYFEEGTQVKPVAEDAVRKMVLAGVTELVVTVTAHSNGVMSYFRDGRQLGLPITYVWSDDQWFSALNSAHDQVAGKDVAMCLGSMVYDPPSCLQRTAVEYKQDSSDMVIGSLGTRKFLEAKNGQVTNTKAGIESSAVFVWGPRFTALLRALFVDGDELSFDQIINKAVVLGYNIRTVNIPNGKASMPHSLTTDLSWTPYRPLHV